MQEKVNSFVIHFVTSNQGKIKTLGNLFRNRGRPDVEVEGTKLDLIEPQADVVSEVSLSKARQAYGLLKKSVLVEDGGLAIEALRGFPGVYSKYVSQTLGATGIVKLMAGVPNRSARFVSTATYIGENGQERQFPREGGEVSIANEVSDIESPLAWSPLWRVIRIDRYQKVMSEMTREEINEYYSDGKSSLDKFADWFLENIE